MMRIGRTLAPAASPIGFAHALNGLVKNVWSGNRDDSDFAASVRTSLDKKYCFPTSTGKAALVLILQALKGLYPERERVIIPAFTCFSVPAAIKRAGLEIEVCDVSPATLDFDYEKLEKIAARYRQQGNVPLCIVPTHLFGLNSDVAGTRTVVGENVVIVEDAAQVFGSSSGDAPLGTQGDIGFYSFGRGKALSFSEGGAIITDNNELGERLTDIYKGLPVPGRFEMYKQGLLTIGLTVFQHPLLFWFPKLLPFLRLGETIYDPEVEIKKMSPYQVSLTRSWEPRLAAHRRARKNNFLFWKEKIITNALPWNIDGGSDPGAFIRLPVLCRSEKVKVRIVGSSEKKGLGIMGGYPSSIHKIPMLDDSFRGVACPGADEVARRLLTIPLHEYVTENDNRKICKLLDEHGLIKS